jgi:hypothetical protein
MKGRSVALAVLALVLAVTSEGATETVYLSSSALKLPQGVPLPPIVTIDIPDRTLTKELASLSGVWVGTWRPSAWVSGDVEAVLVVENITPQNAIVLLARGEAPPAWLSYPAWIRKRAEITGGVIRIEFPRVTVALSLVTEGLVRGEQFPRWEVSYSADFRKVPVDYALASKASAKSTQDARLPAGVPLPQDIKIVPPKPIVPQKSAAFSGMWVGSWDGMRDEVLVVEEIDQFLNQFLVTVVTAGGAAPQWNLKPGWSRKAASFQDEALKVDSERGTATYRMNTDGTINALWEGKSGYINRARLLRIK